MKKGNVEIILQEKGERILYCSRIGGMENGSFVLEEDFIDKDLEEGVYLLNSSQTEVQGREKILPTLLYLPSWDAAEEEMLYDITVLPKYGVDPPSTGDSSELAAWSIFFALSAAFLGYKFKKTLKKEKCF